MARPKTKKPITIVERRLQSGSVFGTSSKPIPLVEPERWEIRIVNSQISNDHLYTMQSDKGWVYAHPEDLAVDPKEIGFVVLDGRIVRGQQGQEVVMKMERADYRAIQTQKEVSNRQQTFGAKANKQAILNAVQGEVDGDRGADFLNRAVQSITVTDSTERVSLDE